MRRPIVKAARGERARHASPIRKDRYRSDFVGATHASLLSSKPQAESGRGMPRPYVRIATEVISQGRRMRRPIVKAARGKRTRHASPLREDRYRSDFVGATQASRP